MSQTDLQQLNEILARSIYFKRRNDKLNKSREMISRLENKERKNGKHD
jgi:hypothetical protein